MIIVIVVMGIIVVVRLLGVLGSIRLIGVHGVFGVLDLISVGLVDGGLLGLGPCDGELGIKTVPFNSGHVNLIVIATGQPSLDTSQVYTWVMVKILLLLEKCKDYFQPAPR